MSVLFIKSAFDGPSVTVKQAEEQGRLRIVPQERLGEADLAEAQGLITGNQLDQNRMLALVPALTRFLDQGGRWFFNGHILRAIIPGVAPYEPMPDPKAIDFQQTRLADHPIFDGIALAQVETNKGVGGFYGRGANPMPEGAIAITGLRNGTVPVDWVWPRPQGGRVFSHAGNDLGQMGLEHGLSPLLTERIIDWAGGGACLCD